MSRNKVKLYNSNTATDSDVKSKLIDTNTPDGKIINGEIAFVNTEGYEAIYHLNSDGTNLIQYLPINRITADKIKLNDYSISSGKNEDLSPTNEDTISQAIGKLHKAILDDEKVIASALSKSNESCGFDENGNLNFSGTQIISDSKTIVDALTSLDNNISDINSKMSGELIKLNNYEISDKENEELEITSADTINQAIGKLHKAILDDEMTISSALSKSNETCGFDENGNLGFSGTNYLDNAISIIDALKILDAKIKEISA